MSDPKLHLAGANEQYLVFRDYGSGKLVFAEAAEHPILKPLAGPNYSAAAVNPVQPVVAAFVNDRLLVYDFAADRIVFETPHDSNRFTTSIEYSADGAFVAALGAEGGCPERQTHCPTHQAIQVYDAHTGVQIYSAKYQRADRLALTPDGRTLAVAIADEIRLFSLPNGKLLGNIEVPSDDRTNSVPEMTFSPDSRQIAWTRSGIIRVINVATARVTRSFSDPPQVWMSASTMTKDGRLLAAVKRLTGVTVAEFGTHTTARTLDAGSPVVGEPLLSGSGTVVAAHTLANKIRVWDVGTSAVLCDVPAAGAVLAWPASALSASGHLLAFLVLDDKGEFEHALEVWDVRRCSRQDIIERGPGSRIEEQAPVEEGFPIDIPPQNMGRTRKVEFGPNDRSLAWYTVANSVHVYDLQTRHVTAKFRVPVPAVFTEVDRAARKLTNFVELNHRRVPVAEANSTSVPESLLTYKQMWRGLNGITFAPDGLSIATLDVNGQTRFWHTSGGQFAGVVGSISADRLPFVVDGAFQGPFGTATAVFSPDGSTVVPVFGKYVPPTIWNLATKTPVKQLKGFGTWPTAAIFTTDGKRLVFTGPTSWIGIADVASGEVIGRLAAFGSGTDWIVSMNNGLFDGTPRAYRQLSWGFKDQPFAPIPMEAFFADFYRPGLLIDVLSGALSLWNTPTPEKSPSRDIASIDRRQAMVTVDTRASLSHGYETGSRELPLSIRIRPAPADDMHPDSAPVQDIHLFRNGSLVRAWHGAIKPSADGIVEVSTEVPVLAGANEFVAYCFNQDNVKSRDGVLYVKGSTALARKGSAHILAVGIDRYDNPRFKLRYAAADAARYVEELHAQLEKSGRFARVETVTMMDETATKGNLLQSLERLQPHPGSADGVLPEDSVFLYFAGHGWSLDNRFYLIPHDLGYAGDPARLLGSSDARASVQHHAVSDSELAGALEKIDAANITLVIDACNSGQVLESEESRQGPFNSRRLAQLAWDKGMYILTAAQSYQAALETSQLRHGYLTYALIEEGLREMAADWDPKDRKIDVREWFDYASKRVPELQRKYSFSRLLVQTQSFRSTTQIPRVFYRRDDRRPFVVVQR